MLPGFLKHCWLCSCHCHQVISSCEETTKKLLSVTYTATDHQQRPFCVTREFNSGMGKLCILCLSSKGFLCLLHVSVVCFFPLFCCWCSDGLSCAQNKTQVILQKTCVRVARKSCQLLLCSRAEVEHKTSSHTPWSGKIIASLKWEERLWSLWIYLIC